MTHCTHVSFTVEWSMVAVPSLTFTRLHVVVVVLHKATWQHRSKCTPSKKKRELQKGKGGVQVNAARCKTDVLYPDSTPLPTLNWDADSARPLLEGAEESHGERDEAVVSLDVPLENLRARSQHALKADPVQLDAFERAPGDDGGRPGAVQQQGDFTWGGGSALTGGSTFHLKASELLYLTSWKTYFQTAANIMVRTFKWFCTFFCHTGFPLMFIYSAL